MRINRRGLVGSIAVAGLLAGACMSASMGTGLTQLSADTYRISRVDGVGRYPDAEAMKAAVAEEASAFARGQGKVAVPISSHHETMRAGHLSTVEYEFRLAAPGEAAGTAAATPSSTAVIAGPKEPAVASVAPAAPAVAAAAASPSAKAADIPVVAAAPPAMPVSTPQAKPDLYNELIMLDDLRKRGILTDAEFQALKTKLLAGK